MKQKRKTKTIAIKLSNQPTFEEIERIEGKLNYEELFQQSKEGERFCRFNQT